MSWRNGLLDIRSGILDCVLIGGWLAIVLAGQALFNVEMPWLEWLAAAWLWAGMLLVRRTLCLPWVILSCPAFLCEPHRDWAWAQPVMMTLLFARVLVENRFTLRQRFVILLVGALVAAASLPRDAPALLHELLAFPRRELLRQLSHPSAVWAIFPFWQTFARALVAMVCAGILLSGRYLHTGRAWNALWLCAALAAVAAILATVAPWQQDHRFLGTTNFGGYKGRLFCGAGYGVMFFTPLLAVGLAFFFVPLRDRLRPLRLGSAALLLPAALIYQRAFALAVMALALAAIVAAGVWVARRFGRTRPRRPERTRLRRLALGAAAFVSCLFLAAAWYVKLGILQEDSLLRQQLRVRADSFFSLNDRRSTAVPRQGLKPLPAHAQAPAAFPAAAASNVEPTRPTSWAGIERLLNRLDHARGSMWSLGARTSLERRLWRGAGAGTWARFHRAQPRPERIYFAHMHNTHLDLVFEYGVAPMAIALAACALALGRIAAGRGGVPRFWVFPLIGVAVIGLGQHLLFAFTSLCLLLPLFIILARALFSQARMRAPTMTRSVRGGVIPEDEEEAGERQWVKGMPRE
ncbi:MAG: hypothetical protein QME60_03145 [Verrucomicrobiota bacterium]|nr:hypothetical protein [Verrucomicrobiota bacterium]